MDGTGDTIKALYYNINFISGDHETTEIIIDQSWVLLFSPFKAIANLLTQIR